MRIIAVISPAYDHRKDQRLAYRILLIGQDENLLAMWPPSKG